MSWTKETWRKGVAKGLFVLGNRELQIEFFKMSDSEFANILDELDSYVVFEELDFFLSQEFLSQEEYKGLTNIGNLVDQIINTYEADNYSGLANSSEWKELSRVARTFYLNYFKETHLSDPNGWLRKYPLLD